MNYSHPDLIEKLSAEYVLGTLKGPARKRFERLMMDSYNVRMAVWSWEQQITPLVDSVEPVKPPQRVWKKIRAGVSARDMDYARFNKNALQQFLSSLFPRLYFPNGLSSFSVMTSFIFVAVLVGAVFIGGIQQTETGGFDQVAVFNGEDRQPLWVVKLDQTSGEYVVTAVNSAAKFIDDKAYELWMLPTDGSAPESMGLMPVGDKGVEFVLSPQVLSQIRGSGGLAVSLEPPGGSPTGLPTGPVLYQTHLVPL